MCIQKKERPGARGSPISSPNNTSKKCRDRISCNMSDFDLNHSSMQHTNTCTPCDKSSI